MAMYYSVTGWSRVYDFNGGEAAIREAIGAAVRNDPDYVRAQATADAWTFTGEAHGFGGRLAIWNGNVKSLNYVRAQVEAIVAAIPADGIGHRGWDLDGLFHIMPPQDDAKPREWRLYGSHIHEVEREIPPYDFMPVPPADW